MKKTILFLLLLFPFAYLSNGFDWNHSLLGITVEFESIHDYYFSYYINFMPFLFSAIAVSIPYRRVYKMIRKNIKNKSELHKTAE